MDYAAWTLLCFMHSEQSHAAFWFLSPLFVILPHSQMRFRFQFAGPTHNHARCLPALANPL